MNTSRQKVQARKSLLAILIILTAIIIETGYTSGSQWYWWLFLIIPATILLTGKSNPWWKRYKRRKNIKLIQWQHS